MLHMFVALLVWAFCCYAEVLDQEAKFHIKENNVPIPNYIAEELKEVGIVNDITGAYEVVSIKNQDMNILCFLPDSKNESLWEVEESNKPNRTSDQLLDQILPNFMYYFDAQQCTFTTGLNEGYWTYGYCYGDKIIQFHENLQEFQRTGVHSPEEPNYVFVLGRFNGSDSKTAKILNQSTQSSRILKKEDFEIVTDPITPGIASRPQRALKHIMRDGELCDLTKQPRTVEVIYRCDVNSDMNIVIISVVEVKTCQYRVIINVKGLCSFEEFCPHHMDEKIVDIVCNPVVENEIEGPKTDLKEMFEFQLPSTLLPVFPQPKTNRLDLHEYSIIPGGHGYYWGRPRNYPKSDYIYDRRSVLVYNGYDSDPFKRIVGFSKMFCDSMESKVFSPFGDSLATWFDSFTAWYEMYDYKGNFLNVVRVDRNGTLPAKALIIQFIDPFTMLDQDGDSVPSPTPVSSNRKIYEYESFSKGEPKAPTLKLEPIKKEDIYTSTVTITKVIENPTDVIEADEFTFKLVDENGNVVEDDKVDELLKSLADHLNPDPHDEL